MVSLCSALLGVSLVLKRYSMIGDGLSHVGFGALAIAAAANAAPLTVAIPVVVLAAVLLLRISGSSKIKGDAAIALISTSALAVGVMVISMTTGMNTDVYNYMFGSILAMSSGDVRMSVLLSAAVLILYILFYHKIFAITFDETFALATGVKAVSYTHLDVYKRQLQAGRHVVTANKDLVAEYGRELLDAAEENHCDFLFEAAVAGGIPIIRPLKQCLAGNDISEVIGIVNGTTNYILTKMFEENMSFESALAKATELGYAEADPTADVEGLDAGRKVAIMASIAFHSRVVFKDVYTEGITRISPEDIAYAKEFDSVIKLLGVAHNTETGIEVGVYPMLLNKEHPLASVRDSFNAVFVHGDAVDDAMFYGRGAGELPTASAVVGDIIDVARDLQYGCMGRISCTCYRELPVKDFSEVRNKFFLRMQVKNQPGVLACIAQVFGDHKVSIARVVQKHVKENQAELVIVTEKVKEYHLQDALTGLKEMESILEISSIIREY